MGLYNKYALKKAQEKAFGGNEIKEIPLEKLKENPYQPRIDMDENKIKELAESIEKKGLLQPILVAQNSDGGYTIIAGHRRTQAYKLLGRSAIKAVVLKNQKTEDLASKAIIENLQREDLNVLEYAITLKNYKDFFGKTQEEIAKEIGKTKGYVSQILSVLNLPDAILEDLKNKKTADVTALNILNTFYKKFSKLNFSNPDIAKKTTTELYQGYLQNGREWLKEEINKKLEKKREYKPKISIKKNAVKVDIKNLPENAVLEFKNFIEEFAKKHKLTTLELKE